MKFKKSDMFLVIVCLLVLVGTAISYSFLPDIVPSHWNVYGQIDAYSAKWTVFVTGSIPFLIYGLMKVLPIIDPKRYNYEKSPKAYSIITIIIVIVMALIQSLVLLASLGVPVKINVVIPVIIGIMFVIMGNYFPQIRPNYFMGIKTPWTLASETVWKKTHKVGGYGFVFLGILFILQAVYTNAFIFMAVIGALLLFVVYIFIYSYVLFKKEQRDALK